MNQCLKKTPHKLPILTQYEIDYLNGPIIIKIIEFTFTNLLQIYSGKDGLTGEFYQTFEK